MKGLKEVAGKSVNAGYGGIYYQVNYNKSTDEVFVNEFCDYGGNWYACYDDDKDIIVCGRIYKKVTMKEVRKMVEEALEDSKEASLEEELWWKRLYENNAKEEELLRARLDKTHTEEHIG